jgi:hypothetical protein
MRYSTSELTQFKKRLLPNQLMLDIISHIYVTWPVQAFALSGPGLLQRVIGRALLVNFHFIKKLLRSTTRQL